MDHIVRFSTPIPATGQEHTSSTECQRHPTEGSKTTHVHVLSAVWRAMCAIAEPWFAVIAESSTITQIARRVDRKRTALNARANIIMWRDTLNSLQPTSNLKDLIST